MIVVGLRPEFAVRQAGDRDRNFRDIELNLRSGVKERQPDVDGFADRKLEKAPGQVRKVDAEDQHTEGETDRRRFEIARRVSGGRRGDGEGRAALRLVELRFDLEAAAGGRDPDEIVLDSAGKRERRERRKADILPEAAALVGAAAGGGKNDDRIIVRNRQIKHENPLI